MTTASQSQFLNQTRLTSGGPTYSLPVLIGASPRDGSERIAAGRPCRLCIQREFDGASAAIEGTINIFGKNLPAIDGKNSGNQRMVGADGTTGRTIFATNLTYVAWANYNWVVLVNGVVIANGSGAGKCQISDGSPLAIVTFGTALAVTDKVQITYGVPVELMADGAHPFEDTQIIGKDLVWAKMSHAASIDDLSATKGWIKPAM